jgi:hydrogenase maturation protease
LKIKIIGCGNTIAGNDGLGIRVIQELKSLTLPEDVELIEGGINGLDLLEYFMNTDRVIIIDAVILGDLPGTIYRLSLSEIEGMSKISITSLHQFGIAETVAIGMKLYPESMCSNIILIGVEIGKIEHSICEELSPEIINILPEVKNIIVKEIYNA